MHGQEMTIKKMSIIQINSNYHSSRMTLAGKLTVTDNLLITSYLHEMITA